MFSLRIVNVDHYLSSPIPGVDVTYSDFRCCRVRNVPVVRVFGATPAGQKTCLHLHGIFPYICVPCGGSPLTGETEKELHQLAVSLDRAINATLGKSSATDAQHVYKISLVSGTPFYGYHSKEQHFYKIYFYNPLMVKRAVELLQSGAVLNKAFQPHEAHIPFILQMFIDYNLYGMNLLNLASVKFRKRRKTESSLEVETSWNEASSDRINLSSQSNSNSFPLNQNSYSAVKYRKWNYDSISDVLFLPDDVERQSTCELEVDAIASDILNRMELMSNPGMNPGIKFIWEDEKQRRKNEGKDSQITPPTTQDRGEIPLEPRELRYLDHLKTMINDSKNKSSFNDTPLDLSNNNVTNICVIPARSQEMHTPNDKDLNRTISTIKIETEAVINEDLVESISQTFNNSQQGSSVLDSQDKDLIDVLAKMCSSQALGDTDSILSTRSPIEKWDQTKKQFGDENEPNDECETQEMSQLIWETDPNIVTDTLPQVDGPVDPKQAHSGLNRTQRFTIPASQTYMSATSEMRLKTARKSFPGSGISTLHPIPSPVTNHQYRSAWPAQPMQAMPSVSQNLLYQNQHPSSMHWTYRDYNMWHPMDMGPTPGFPAHSVGMDEQKKLMSPANCWPNSSAGGQTVGSNCREFSAMNPFSDAYPSMHYNRQERLPSLNMPSCLATPPGGFYEPHSFIPPLNYNCEMTMPKECIKYQQQQQHHQQQQQQQPHQQQQQQPLVAAGNTFNCMETAMNGSQKNFISLQRISYVSKDYQVSWPDEFSRNDQSASYYNEQAATTGNPVSVNVRTACSDVLAAAMSSSGIDMHSLAEVCEEEEQCVEFTEGPVTASACRVEENSVMVVSEREQRISAVTKRCKTSVVACLPNSYEGQNENWDQQPEDWEEQTTKEEKKAENEPSNSPSADGNVEEEPKEAELEPAEMSEKVAERAEEEMEKANTTEDLEYVLPDLSSIIESEELLEEQGTGMDLQDEKESEDQGESPNLCLSDISEEDGRELEESIGIDEYHDNKVALPETEKNEENDEKKEENEPEVDVAISSQSNVVEEELLLSEEDMANVILIELNENEQFMVLDVSDEKVENEDLEEKSSNLEVITNVEFEKGKVFYCEGGAEHDVSTVNMEENVALDGLCQKVPEITGGLGESKGEKGAEMSESAEMADIVNEEVTKTYRIIRSKVDFSPEESRNGNSEKKDDLSEKSMMNETGTGELKEIMVEKALSVGKSEDDKQSLGGKANENENLMEKLKSEENDNFVDKSQSKESGNFVEKLNSNENDNFIEKSKFQENKNSTNISQTIEIENFTDKSKATENENFTNKSKCMENQNSMQKSKQNENLTEKSKFLENENFTQISKSIENDNFTENAKCKENKNSLKNWEQKEIEKQVAKDKPTPSAKKIEKQNLPEKSKKLKLIYKSKTKSKSIEKSIEKLKAKQQNSDVKQKQVLKDESSITRVEHKILETPKKLKSKSETILNNRVNVDLAQNRSQKSIESTSTSINENPRTPVLEKMASLVRRALSNLHDRELMTDLTIASIDSNSCTRNSSKSNKTETLPSAYKRELSSERGEGNIKNSSQSNGSLAGKGSMRRSLGCKKNKLDVQSVPVRTRTVGTNVHPQDLPRRRSGHLYFVRYHGLRVTVDEKGLEDLKKLGKERVCVTKLKTDVVKVSDCKRRRSLPTKKWTLQRNGDVCEGLKMRFTADRKAEENRKKEKKDLGIAQGRERRLKVDYKPHAFSHIFKFDVMPELDSTHKRKLKKVEDLQNINNKASLKLLLKKKNAKKTEVLECERVDRSKNSFGWSISRMDSMGKVEKKRKSKCAKSNKSPLTLIMSPVKNEKKCLTHDEDAVVAKKTEPLDPDGSDKQCKRVEWSEEIEPGEEMATTPPPCWSPNEMKVYEDLKPLETLHDGPVEENGNLDGWLPFNFTLDHVSADDHFEQLKAWQASKTHESQSTATSDDCERNDGVRKPVLIHRGVEDSEVFSDSSVDVEHVDEKDCILLLSDSEQKDTNLSIDMINDDFCPQSDDEREPKTKETPDFDEEMVTEDENFQDSLIMSDLSDDENGGEKEKAAKKTSNHSVCSQDLFPMDESHNSDQSDDLFVVTDAAALEAQSSESNESTLEVVDSPKTQSLESDDNTPNVESLPTSSPTPGIQSFYGNETPDTPTFMVDARDSETSTLTESRGLHTPPIVDSVQKMEKHEKVYTWHCPPPSRKEIEESLKQSGFEVYKHTEAHFSCAADGRREIVENFRSKFDTNGLDNCRAILCAASDDSCQDIVEEMKSNTKLRAALLGRRDIIITPSLKPPDRNSVEESIQTKKQPPAVKETVKAVPSRVSTPQAVEINVPQHSTPRGRHVVPMRSPAFTPILKKRKRSDEDEDESEMRNKVRRIAKDESDGSCGEFELSEENSVDTRVRDQKWKKHAMQLSGRTSPFICRVEAVQKEQVANKSVNSQLSGPSLANSHGFKVTYDNLKDAKTVCEYQFLTLFSLELHTRTRRNLRPDPNIDSICAVFYSIYNDIPESWIVGQEMIGCLAVSDDQTTERHACTCSKDISMPGLWKCSSCRQLKRHLAARTGIVNIKTTFVSSEMQLIDAVIQLVRKWDPDILIGYELETSSWGFLLQRARFLKLDLQSLLSRIPKLKTDKMLLPVEKNDIEMEELQIRGRIVLNLWHLMRREITLTSYRFENVAYHILHQRIPLYSYKNLSEWFDHHSDLYRWRTIEHYIVRCHGNIRLLLQVDFIGRTSELARLFGIQFYEVLSRGSQFRVESMMLRLAKPLNYVSVSPSIQQRAKSCAPQCLPLILEPESKFYSNPVLVLDFQSLYPSVIIAYNYCYSTCLGHVDSLKELELFKFGCTNLSVSPAELKELNDGSNLNISPTGNVFVKSNIRRGVIPQMLEEILETRIMVKKAMKDCKNNKSLTKILDARQLGLKLIANVTYGYTAANYSGRMPCSEVADSVVGKARETLERAINMVNANSSWNARVVYGDTDSLFVHLPGRSKSDAFKIGQEIADAVTAANPKPVKLKFDKVYLPCVLETKKRYVGFMYETPDQEEAVFDAKGIETVRRDGCPAVVKVLEKSLRLLFTTRDLSKVKSYVQRQFQKIFAGRVSLQDFTLAREYRGRNGYKPNACVPALEIAKKLTQDDPRAEPLAGDRVPYVIVYGSPGAPLFQLVRRPEEVLLDTNLRINAHYYVNNLIIPALQRVFGLLEVNVQQWFTSMSRISNHKSISNVDKRCSPKKGTISQYFSPMNCPGCGDTNSKVLCPKCRADPQMVVVSLSGQIQELEKNYFNLTNICASCTGNREKMSCISLDCPVFYSFAQASKDLNQVHYLRKNIDLLLDF